MKYCFAFVLIAALFFASSCKKTGNSVSPDSIDTLQSNGHRFDYASVQIDGKTYICQTCGGSIGWGNRQVNRKIASVGVHGIDLDKGDPDSILFSREYTLTNDSTLYMTILFCKKVAKKDCLKEFWFYTPIDQLALFRTGLQGFATDFERENSYDGIGISLRLKEGDESVTYSTYSLQFPNLTTAINNDSQKGSYFDITKLATAQEADYIEAAFKAKVFNLKEEVKSIDKGFLRLKIGYFTKQ